MKTRHVIAHAAQLCILLSYCEIGDFPKKQTYAVAYAVEVRLPTPDYPFNLTVSRL